MKLNVHIWRDEHGVPHVEAEDLADLYRDRATSTRATVGCKCS